MKEKIKLLFWISILSIVIFNSHSMAATVETVGTESMNSGWWESFGSIYKFTGNGTWKFNFRNRSGGEDGWDNYVMVFTNQNKINHHGNDTSYKEYAVIRADGHSWGYKYNVDGESGGITESPSDFETPYGNSIDVSKSYDPYADFSTYQYIMRDANVNITLKKDGGNIYVDSKAVSNLNSSLAFDIHVEFCIDTDVKYSPNTVYLTFTNEESILDFYSVPNVPKSKVGPLDDSKLYSSNNGTNGSVAIGEDKEGNADSGSGVSQFFPDSWSLKTTRYPLELEQTENADGTYTIKGTIGILRNDLLDKDSEWSKYKKVCNTIDDNLSKTEKLEAYRDMFGLKSSTAIHAEGWSGSKKPELSIMGYVENTYDKYGNLIKAEGKVAGELGWKGHATWNFATPIGPMYLKFEAGGKIKLSLGPNYDIKNKQFSFGGDLTITPSISLTGGYGVDGVAALSAKGECSLPIKLKKTNITKWGTSGTFKAEASVNLYVAFIIDKEWVLATYEKKLWDTTGKLNTMSDVNKLISPMVESEETSLISTDFNNKKSKWQGKVLKTASDISKILQKGILASSMPVSAKIGGNQVLVWQDYDNSRSIANSSVLKYSVLNNGNWSAPKAVYDNGCGDMFADLKVWNNELYLVWQKQNEKISSEDVDELLDEIGEKSEIFISKFNEESASFEEIEQLTNNSKCDTLPQIIEDSDSLKVSYISNDENDITLASGTNTIRVIEVKSKKDTEICNSDKQIGKYKALESDGNVLCVYTAIENQVTSVETNDSDFRDKINNVSDGEISIGSIENHDHYVDIILNGKLYEYDIDEKNLVEYRAGEYEEFGEGAKYVSNGEKVAYVWSSYDNENSIGSIKASLRNEDGSYSAPIDVFDSGTNIPRYISPFIDDDGAWSIVSNEENIEDNINELCYYKKNEKVSSSLISAEINEYEKLDNETGIDFSYVNDGDTLIKEFQVQIKAEDGSIVKKSIRKDIYPGEILVDTVYMDISDVGKGQNVTITITAEDESISDKNKILTNLAATNVGIQATASETSKGIDIVAIVENKEENEVSGSVQLYDNPEKENQIAIKRDLTYKSRNTTEIRMTITKDKIKYIDGVAYLTIFADVEGGDFDESDNTAYIVLYEGEEVDVDTEPISKEKITQENADNPQESKDNNENQSQSEFSTNNDEDINSSNVSKLAPNDTSINNKSVIKTDNKVTKLAKVKSLKVKNKKKKKAVVTFKKVSGAKGYQIQYALNKKFTKGKKSKFTKKTKYTVKKLKKKKTYYFRVRAYKIVNGTKKYGKWSAVKKLKIKK